GKAGPRRSVWIAWVGKAHGLQSVGLGYLLSSTPARLPRRAHTTKTDVRGAAVRGSLAAAPGKVAHAIQVAAQERSAALNPFLDPRLHRIVTVVWAFRVALESRPVGVGPVPVGAPFPDVAGHVVQPVTVGRKRLDRGRPAEAVLERVLVRETPLPDIR